MHFERNKEKEKWIKEYVEGETAVARKRVQDADTAIMQEQEDISTVQNAGATTRKPKKPVKQMLNAVGESLSDLASSDDDQDGEDKDDDEEDPELSTLSDDNEPSWVMGTISKTVQHSQETVRQKQMQLDELTQPGWGDAANNFHERKMKSRTAELKVPAVFKPQIDITTASPSLTTFRQLMQTRDI